VTPRQAEIKFALWKTPQIPLEIEYSVGVMEEIQAAACAALREVPVGEKEIGGVLFGEHQEHSIRIQAWRPIMCQHAEGPTLRLLSRDRVELACLLELARRSEDLRDLQPLGWFVSHPRAAVGLCAADMEVYHSFFPYAWQITLVVQPAKDGRARCGFFLRAADGTLRSDSSYREFELEPVRPPAPAEMAPIFSWANTEPRELPADKKPSLSSEDQTSAPFLQAAATGVPADPSFDREPTWPRNARLALPAGWFWAILILLAIGVGGFLVKQRASPHFNTFSLHVLDSGETLQVEWDRDSALMQQARAGVLEIKDGGKSTRYSLSPDEIRAGVLSYVRQSRDVDLIMTVYPPTGPAVQGFGWLIVPADAPAKKVADTPPPPPSSDTTELRADRDALQAHVTQLEESLRKEAAEKNRLESLVRILENRLNITSSGKGSAGSNPNK
jgi:hypothetical protein